MLDGPDLSCAANARLHFVNDEHYAVLVTDAAKFGQEICVRNNVAAFALHGLDYDGRAIFGRNGCSEYGLLDVARNTTPNAFARAPLKRESNRVRIRHMRHVERLRAEASCAV